MPLVQPFVETLPYRVTEGPHAKPIVTVNIGGKDKAYSPEELTGMLFSKLRELAEARLGQSITHAAVSVPHLVEDQGQAIKDAGARGGLTVLRVVNSYTAATIGYGLDVDSDERKVVVYDTSGDNLRVAVLEVEAGVFEILHTSSVKHYERAAVQLNADLPLEYAMRPLKEALGANNSTLHRGLSLIWQTRESRSHGERHQQHHTHWQLKSQCKGTQPHLLPHLVHAAKGHDSCALP